MRVVSLSSQYRRGIQIGGAVLAVLLAYELGERMGSAAARPAPVVMSVPTSQKVIALTFDDGPTSRWTPKILAVLKAANVKATFFVIGQMAQRYPRLIRAEVRAGMDVESHGYAHLVLHHKNDTVTLSEVTGVADVLTSLGVPEPHLYRMPAGIYDAAALKLLGQLGYTVVGWSVDPRDWRHVYSASQMVQIVLKQAAPGGIIIFHDGTNSSAATVAAVREVIQALKQDGYRFVTVKQLLTMAKGRI